MGTRVHKSLRTRMTMTHDFSPLALAYRKKVQTSYSGHHGGHQAHMNNLSLMMLLCQGYTIAGVHCHQVCGRHLAHCSCESLLPLLQSSPCSAEPPQGCQVKWTEARSVKLHTTGADKTGTATVNVKDTLWSKLTMLQNLSILYQKTKRRTKCKPGTTWRVGGTPGQQGISACPERPGGR